MDSSELRRNIKMARLNLKESVTSCLICGRKNMKFCHSHSVPKFILKEISKNGKLAFGVHLLNKNENFINKVFMKNKLRENEKLLGIKNTGTFKLICEKCDNEIFKDYESPKFLLGEELSNQVMNLIALKNHLYFYYKIYVESTANLQILYDNYVGKPFTPIEHSLYSSIMANYQLKMKELKGYRRNIKEYVKGLKKPFPMKVIVDKTLNYNVQFAFSLFFLLGQDLEGKTIYNLKDYSRVGSEEGRVYLSIFPYQEKTRMIMYYRRRYAGKLRTFDRQISDCSDQELQENLTRLIVGHHEEFYMNPDYYLELKKRKRIVKLFKSNYIPNPLEDEFDDFSYKRDNMFNIIICN
jgi:hypothetical protein